MPDPLLQPVTPPPVIPPPPTAVGYTPATATAATAPAVGFAAKPYEVAREAKVASQLEDIIDKGSPLMQQARQYALEQMGARGLTNSSLAVGAGQGAIIQSALPIATADAGTFARAGEMSTTAENTARQFKAAAENTAGLQDAQLKTSTGQFNAGQQNAAGAAKAQAQNTMLQTRQQIEGQAALQTQQIAGAQDLAAINNAAAASIETMRSNTSLTIADKQAASAKFVAELQANTQLSLQDKTTAIQKYIADLQSTTTIGIEQAKNLTQTAIATMQTDATLTIEQQKVASAQLIASLQSQTTLQQQALINSAAIENIKAKGLVDVQLTTTTEQYKQLLQTNVGAQNLYTQTIQAIGTVWNNPALSQESKAAAANGLLATMNEGLATLSAISSAPNVQTNLNFSGALDVGPYAPPTVTPSVTQSPGITTGIKPGVTQQSITDAYQTILGRAPDAAGLSYYLNSGMTLQQIQSELAYNKQADVAAQQPAPAPGQQPAPPPTPGQPPIIQPPAAPQPSMTPEAAGTALTGMYQSIFGRAPDAAGLQYYQQQIAQGRSVAEIQAELLASPEGQISGLYNMVFGRPPDAQGLAYYMGSGMTQEQIRNEFLASPEARQPATDQLIKNLYKFVLGRDADAAGLANLTNSGMTPFAIYQSMKLSPEYLNAHPEFRQTPEFQWLTTYKQPTT